METSELTMGEIKALLEIEAWHWQLSCEQIDLIKSLGDKGNLIKQALSHHYQIGLEHGSNISLYHLSQLQKSIAHAKREIRKDITGLLPDLPVEPAPTQEGG